MNKKRRVRPKSTESEVNRSLAAAIIRAAEQTGEDGRGRNGLVGYLCWVARTHPRSFAALLVRLPPDEIVGEEDKPYVTVDELLQESATKAFWTTCATGSTGLFRQSELADRLVANVRVLIRRRHLPNGHTPASLKAPFSPRNLPLLGHHPR